MQQAYYLSDYMDEVMPCGTGLDDWAEWLSEPDESWGREEPAKNGDTFKAHSYEFHQVEARKVDGEWVFDPSIPVGTEWMAVRYGDGLGWDAEDTGESLPDFGDVLDWHIGDNEKLFVACAMLKPSVTLVYRDKQLTIQPQQ